MQGELTRRAIRLTHALRTWQGVQDMIALAGSTPRTVHRILKHIDGELGLEWRQGQDRRETEYRITRRMGQ